jgi:ferredoxin
MEVCVVKVVVDMDLCEGNAMCMGSAPEVFQVNGDKVTVVQQQPGDELRHKVEDAVRACPTQALSLED